jgi:hypothetical protein
LHVQVDRPTGGLQPDPISFGDFLGGLGEPSDLGVRRRG